MRSRLISAVMLLCVTMIPSCAARVSGERKPEPPPASPRLAELWIDPGGTPRDLFWGSGGRALAPDPRASYALRARDDSGFSVSYDVVDPRGVEWSAKIGPEAQTEVVLSRILWGIGYHQPPIYYLPSWTLQGAGEPSRRESEARFRPKLQEFRATGEYWRWSSNPFTGAPEFRGLLVVLLLFNSTDLKDDNNSIYQVMPPREGASRWFLVRDLGASLGETGKLYPRRNWLEGFERESFITGVTGDRVEFGYRGRHRELLDFITPADLQWAVARLGRLTDAQWRDAFRAANYAPPIADRFLRRVRQKMSDALVAGAADRPAAPRQSPAPRVPVPAAGNVPAPAAPLDRRPTP